MPPQRGSVEFAASHVALHDAVSESGPMSWRAKSLNGENVTLLWFVKIDLPVACCGIWQRLQPTLVKTCCPRVVEAVGGAGVGPAARRMKAAKFTISEE